MLWAKISSAAAGGRLASFLVWGGATVVTARTVVAVWTVVTARTVVAVWTVVAAWGIPGCEHRPAARSTIPASAPSVSAAGLLDRSIRVLLLESVADCEVRTLDPFDLVDAETGNPLARGLPAQQFRVVFGERAIQLPLLNPGTPPAALDLVPRGDAPVEVGLPNARRRYRGSLRFVRRSAGEGDVINQVDLEDYLVGVVSAELHQGFHEEAFRAQAITARTYAWYQKATAGPRREWDVKATQSSQVYVGLERESLVPKAAQAVRGTRGLVCTWASPDGERIFCTYYSSTCGGSTQAVGPVKHEPDIPPLAGGVKCDYCRHSPFFRWGPVRLLKGYMTQQLRDYYPKFQSIGWIKQVEVLERSLDARPVRLGFVDAGGRSISLEAENFRLAVDPRQIKSTFFTPVVEADAVVLTDGRGFGHGLGLCQYGADGLARLGWDAARILRFYYPTSRISRAY